MERSLLGWERGNRGLRYRELYKLKFRRVWCIRVGEVFIAFGIWGIYRGDEIVEMDFRRIIKELVKGFVFCCVGNEGFYEGYLFFNY